MRGILKPLRRHKILGCIVFASICLAIPSDVRSNEYVAEDAGLSGNVEIQTDIVYGHKDGMALTMDLFRPKENSKGIGVLFMVSGGWVSTWMPPEQTARFFKPLMDSGYTVLAVRHGSSPRYVIPEIVSDVRLAMNYCGKNAKELRIDAKRLGVTGFSAGGHLSLMLGTTANDSNRKVSDSESPRIGAVVAVFPPTDLTPYMDASTGFPDRFPALKFDSAKADEFSPLKQVDPGDAPALMIHGDKDELVPIWHSEKIRAAFTNSKIPNELVVIEGAGHGFNDQGTKTMHNRMIQWFDEYLTKP